jgi:Tfp pilus assembly protein PilV
MCQLYQLFQKTLLNPQADPSKGFVLLEVLVAMSLILGIWMALVGTYQHLALRTNQTESKRAEIRRVLDAFEASEQARATSKVNIKGLIYESSRVPSRNRDQYATSQSITKNKR